MAGALTFGQIKVLKFTSRFRKLTLPELATCRFQFINSNRVFIVWLTTRRPDNQVLVTIT